MITLFSFFFKKMYILDGFFRSLLFHVENSNFATLDSTKALLRRTDIPLKLSVMQ